MASSLSQGQGQDQQQQEESPSTMTVHGKPYEGMCCLCSMEDITEEGKNYVEYQVAPSMKWKPALFEASIIDELLKTQFDAYISRVKTTDCQAELRRLLKDGPPTRISDKHALPLDDNETHVERLWFARDNQEIESWLQGAPKTEEERNKLWDELRKFVIVEGKEEGDEDDGEDDGKGK